MAYLKYNLNFPKDKKVYVLGEAGIEHELATEGIEYCGGTVRRVTLGVLQLTNYFNIDHCQKDPEENRFFPSMDFVRAFHMARPMFSLNVLLDASPT